MKKIRVNSFIPWFQAIIGLNLLSLDANFFFFEILMEHAKNEFRGTAVFFRTSTALIIVNCAQYWNYLLLSALKQG